jgi:putative ABC transport system permease protein
VTASEFASFKGGLERLPEVRGVSASSGGAANAELVGVKGDSVTFGMRQVGPEFFSVLELGIAAGRAFSPTQDTGEHANVVVLNRLAALRLGYPEQSAAVGQFVKMGGKTVQIIGISKDVRNGFMTGAPRPLVYALTAAPAEVTIRAAGDMHAAETSVAQLWRQHFPNQYLVVRNQKAQLQMNAGGPQAILQTCMVVAAIIIPLAVFSIYVLSAFAVQRRAREFVMRKLYGARPADIARLLLREFGILQGIAALIGLPLAYVAGRAFVERFTEQAAIGGWALVAALLGAVLITGAATLRHILAASRLAPAQALRSA